MTQPRLTASWSEVECEDCGASLQEVWALTHMDQAKDKEGKAIVT